MSFYVLLFPSTSHGLIKPTATEAQMDGSVSGPIESTARGLAGSAGFGGTVRSLFSGQDMSMLVLV